MRGPAGGPHKGTQHYTSVRWSGERRADLPYQLGNNFLIPLTTLQSIPPLNPRVVINSSERDGEDLVIEREELGFLLDNFLFYFFLATSMCNLDAKNFLIKIHEMYINHCI